MSQLGKHFSLEELTVTHEKLDNTPGTIATQKLKVLVTSLLDPVREMYGFPIRVNSGFRSLAVNKAIGGATKPLSQHTKGEAADLDCVDNARLFYLIRDHFDFDQLIWERGNDLQPDWIHVSFKAQGNRNQVLKFKTKSNIMKDTIKLCSKYSLVILVSIICCLSLFQISCNNQSKPQQTLIDQSNKEKSKSDSLNTVKAYGLLHQKDSIIKVLNSKLATEKANTVTQKADARKQHVANDTLQARFEREKSLNVCEELVQGLKFEIIEKDSVIESLDSENDKYSFEVKVLEDKVSILSGVIDSKQNLIASKDSIITAYKSQQKKKDLWTGIKTKAAGFVILIETIALIIK